MNKAQWETIVPVLGSGHVTLAAYDALAADPGNAAGANTLFVYLGLDLPDELADYPSIVDLYEWFEMNYPGERWLRLDADGDLIPELPWYDW